MHETANQNRRRQIKPLNETRKFLHQTPRQRAWRSLTSRLRTAAHALGTILVPRALCNLNTPKPLRSPSLRRDVVIEIGESEDAMVEHLTFRLGGRRATHQHNATRSDRDANLGL